MLVFKTANATHAIGTCECGLDVSVSAAQVSRRASGDLSVPSRAVCNCGMHHVLFKIPDGVGEYHLRKLGALLESHNEEEAATRIASIDEESKHMKERVLCELETNLNHLSMLEMMLVVSVHAPEGVKISKYFNMITSEVVLGTGLVSEVNARLADFMGVQATAMESKLEEAKELAIRTLKLRALRLGANAIVAVDIDYHSLGSNLLIVVASGTPVFLEC